MSLRWCSTTNMPRSRRDHATLADAELRATELAATIAAGATADGVDKLTIWSNADDLRGWKADRVIDLHALAGAR